MNKVDKVGKTVPSDVTSHHPWSQALSAISTSIVLCQLQPSRTSPLTCLSICCTKDRQFIYRSRSGPGPPAAWHYPRRSQSPIIDDATTLPPAARAANLSTTGADSGQPSHQPQPELAPIMSPVSQHHPCRRGTSIGQTDHGFWIACSRVALLLMSSAWSRAFLRSTFFRPPCR